MYVAGFYYNNGNYRGFGDTKIIPDVDVVRTEAIPTFLSAIFDLSLLEYPSISGEN